MKKFIFFSLILIFILFTGVGYALHFKSIEPFIDFVNKEVKQFNKTNTREVLNQTDNKNQKNKEAGNNNDTKSLKMSFAGDVLLDGHVANLINSKGTGFIISEVKPIISSSDISMINLENPISLRGTKTNKQYTFRANPKNIDVLTSLGIDIVTLANNHSLDYGNDALIDTFDNLKKADIKYVGAGTDINSANKPVSVSKNGYTAAFLGSSHVVPDTSWMAGTNRPGLAVTYDPSRLLTEISSARKKSDIVVVYVHWGEESKTSPLNYQRDLAKKYIDSGADIVIGSHPHVLQGFEFYKGKLIAYSLGNFIFTNLKNDTMILNIKYTGNSFKASMVPCRIVNLRPVIINDNKEKSSLYKHLESISFGVRISGSGEIEPVK